MPPYVDVMRILRPISVLFCHLVNQFEHGLGCSWQGDVSYQNSNKADLGICGDIDSVYQEYLLEGITLKCSTSGP